MRLAILGNVQHATQILVTLQAAEMALMPVAVLSLCVLVREDQLQYFKKQFQNISINTDFDEIGLEEVKIPELKNNCTKRTAALQS